MNPAHTSWNQSKLDRLSKLYSSGLSMLQVAQKMQTTLASINSAMRRHQIKRRTNHETQQIQFYKSPLSFKPRKTLTAKQQQLKVAGLMLYWGEGSKLFTGRYMSVDFANSNPDMVKLFIKFLRKIYGVNEAKLRCLLYCYSSHDVQKLKNFWSKTTKIPLNQFTKPYIRQEGGNNQNKMKYGLIHIRYSDKRLLRLILKEIGQLSYNL